MSSFARAISLSKATLRTAFMNCSPLRPSAWT